MKRVFEFSKLFLIIVSISILSACKSEFPDDLHKTWAKANSADIEVNYINKVDDANLIMDQELYTNAAGNKYGADVLRYYISDITLVNNGGADYEKKLVKLIDQKKTGSEKITLNAVPNGKYTSVIFNLGVPADRNLAGDQEGDLDPAMDMFWSWSTGYIFYKHEGFWVKNSVNQNLRFHYGKQEALLKIEIPLNFEIKGDTKKININFNLNSAYASPNTIDFNVDNDHQSLGGQAETDWVNKMKANFADAFSAVVVE